MPTSTMQKPMDKRSGPLPATDGGTVRPSPAGSDAERAAVALALGYPESTGLTSNRVEQLVRSRLLWEV